MVSYHNQRWLSSHCMVQSTTGALNQCCRAHVHTRPTTFVCSSYKPRARFSKNLRKNPKFSI